MSFLNSLKWSFLGEIAAKLIQPVIFLALTKLLTPADFGVLTAALIVVSFSQIFWEAGLAKALIQRQTDVTEASNVAFWFNLTIGVTFAAILYIASDAIGEKIFHDSAVGPVLRALSVYPILGALASVHLARLRKEMSFRRLFWVRLATVAAPGIASIPLAASGFGYWALVWGLLAGQIAQVVILAFLHPWRPGTTIPAAVRREMFSFGSWVALSGLLTWIYMWADSLVLGRSLGTAELGLYRTGNQVAEIPFILLVSPLMPVLYSQLSRMAFDHKRFRETSIAVLDTLSMLTIPTGLLIASSAEQLELHFFGDDWAGIGQVIFAMALLHGFSYVMAANGEIYRAAGRPRLEALVTTLSLFIYLPLYLWAIQFGFDAFLWTRLGLALSVLSLHFWALNMVSQVGIRALATEPLRVTGIALVILITFRVTGLDDLPTTLGSACALAIVKAVVVFGSIFALERRRIVPQLRSILNL